MPLPLYNGLEQYLPPSSSVLPKRHWGLYHDRYFSAHAPDFTERSAQDKDTQSRVRRWLDTLPRTPVGDGEQLKSKAQRVRAMVEGFEGKAGLMWCEGLFTTGLGNPHPLENGFTWHHTLGTPYLSGAAVKGLVRAVMETAYEGEDKAAVLKRWFGTENKGDVAQQSGQFIFLDALPVKPCQLYVAIMTPHMGKWYEKGAKADTKEASALPGDWHSPVPVQYLAARDLQLQFAILPRTAQAKAELDDVWQALNVALKDLGAGAKTAQGFGAFVPDTKAEAALAETVEAQLASQALEQKLKEATPVDRLLLTLETEMPPGLDKLRTSDQKISQAIAWLDQWVHEFIQLEGIEAQHREQAVKLIKQGFKPGNGGLGPPEKKMKAACKAVRGE